jgi:hypothetical protein
MRKTVVLALAVLVLSAASGAALDIAIGAGYQYQLAVITDFAAAELEQEHTAHLDLRAWPYPLVLGIGVSRIILGPFGSTVSFLNAVLTADYWLLDFPLGSLPLSMHVGAGVYASVPSFGLGIRGSAGLRWTPLPADKGLEVYLELIPTVGGYIAPPIGLVAGGSAGLGVRYWFGR